MLTNQYTRYPAGLWTMLWIRHWSRGPSCLLDLSLSIHLHVANIIHRLFLLDCGHVFNSNESNIPRGTYWQQWGVWWEHSIGQQMGKKYWMDVFSISYIGLPFLLLLPCWRIMVWTFHTSLCVCILLRALPVHASWVLLVLHPGLGNSYMRSCL